MALTESEAKLVRRTKTELRFWTPARYILLALAVASVLFSFRLIYADPYFLSGLGYWIRGIFLITGVLLAIFVLRCWKSPRLRLLVKLADSDEHDAT